MQRTRIKIVGQSGAGLLSVGEILSEAFKNLGFYVVSDREYPSLIKGGYSCFTINISDGPIFSLSREADLMLAIDKPSLVEYFGDLKGEGVLIHGYEKPLGIKNILEQAKKRNMKILQLNAREISIENGGNVLMQNMVLIGMIWKALGLHIDGINKEVEKKFEKKPKLLEIDLKCVASGYEKVEAVYPVSIPEKVVDNARFLINGNKALSLGAIHAGVRAYFAYPMSPASTILTYMAEIGSKFGVVVKQAEDEITAAQMAIGAMYMGTRALVATSGGGYDLMTESVSLAGMIENPLVIVIAQRPGPATGLPTWTMQSDLNLAINSSHGEFPRAVIGVSDAADCFELIQHAFNFAEKYQTPVIVLTEKVICESNFTVEMFKQGAVPIERGLVPDEELVSLKSKDRYKITEDGLSKRWLAGSCEVYFCANGDEHFENGVLTEDGEKAKLIYEKRMKKSKLIEKAMPEPVVYGEAKDADISFIGWGSSKTVMEDIIKIYKEKGVKINYLHYSYLWPFKADAAKKFFEENGNVFLIEGNYLGQFGNIVECKTGKKFKDRLLKYDGMAFYTEDVENFIKKYE